MHRMLLVIAAVAFAILNNSLLEAAEVPPFNGDIVFGQVVVRFTNDAKDAAERVLVGKGYTVKRDLPNIGAQVWSLPAGKTVIEAIEEAAAIPGIVVAEPSYVVRLSAAYDGDFLGYQYAPLLMDLPVAWDSETGSPSVIVAVLDSGVWSNHFDLKSNMIPGWDFADDDGDANPDFEGDERTRSHGTMVAGIIAAVNNNHGGIAGVSWFSKIMPLRLGEQFTAELAAEALLYAARNGAVIANTSFAFPKFSYLLFESVQEAQDAGVLICAAAGNDSCNNDALPQYPASYGLANVLSVASTNVDDRLSTYSNYGARSVDLAAPGEQIYSTCLQVDGLLKYASGTSYAAPQVAGIAALVASKHSAISPHGMRLKIMEGCGGSRSLNGKCVAGRANAAKALSASLPATHRYERTIPPLPVPQDADGVSDVLSVESDLKARDVFVTVNIEHTRMQDLDVTLEHEGKTALLAGGVGSEIGFGPWPENGCTFKTSWLFRGASLHGAWILSIRDTQNNGHTGSLCGWAIEAYVSDPSGGGITCASGSSMQVKNSIIWGNEAANGSQIALKSSTISVSYSNVEDGENGIYMEDSTKTWGTGNITSDPLFADDSDPDPEERDYHLKSVKGRYTPAGWVTDAVSSPSLDGGDPGSVYGNEPVPHGFQINMGAYGNSPQASKSIHWRLEGDVNGDCKVRVEDLWFVRGKLNQPVGSGDNWQADVNRDGKINVLDLIYVRNRLYTYCP